MTVARILARKGRHVTLAEPHATLRDVVDILAEKHIGALIIADVSGAMLGIVSERDVVRAIANLGPDALDDAVSRHMTKEVVTARDDDSVMAIAQKMSSGRFRHMPVIENGRVVGIVSTGDAIKYRLEQMERDQDALREYIATA
jgi:CBS domain-containing protein